MGLDTQGGALGLSTLAFQAVWERDRLGRTYFNAGGTPALPVSSVPFRDFRGYLYNVPSCDSGRDA